MIGDFFQTIFWAALPVTELRAALPVAIAVYHLPVWLAFLAAILGNALPVFLIYGFLPPILRYLQTHGGCVHRWICRYLDFLDHRHRGAYERWGSMALAVFVAIPLPGTGVWTASVLAVLFGVRKRYGIPAILVGMVGAGLMVLALTQGGIALFD